MADEPKEEKAKMSEEYIQKELNARVEEFNKELLPILKKYELGLGATAFVNPNGTIGARPIMFDARPQEGDAAAVDNGAAAPAADAPAEATAA